MKLETTPEELFMLLGEAHVVKYKQELELKQLYMQITEMQNEIDNLRMQLMVAPTKES